MIPHLGDVVLYTTSESSSSGPATKTTLRIYPAMIVAIPARTPEQGEDPHHAVTLRVMTDGGSIPVLADVKHYSQAGVPEAVGRWSPR